ncbi:MAG: Holliday junction resolvase RuvX [bacterium]|nr:Holliday junction resolvase RuvX [bacterium]
MGRILGVDYGTRRIGLALSDPLQITAQPYDAWTGVRDASLIGRFVALIRQEDVDRVVVGHPLTLKGTASRFCEAVERFAGALGASCPVPVILWDERLTSVQAHRVMHDMGKRPGREKPSVDVLAAALMLQSYLDSVTRPRT